MTKETFEHLLEKTDFFIGNVKKGVIPENFNVPENSARKRKVQFISLIDRCILELFLEYGRMLSVGDPENRKLKQKLERFYLFKSQFFKKKWVTPDNIFYDLIYNNNLADYIFLLMTRACQLRCEYCLVKKYNADISFDLINNLFRAIAESGKKKSHIQFFGGEPFLRFPMMKKTVELAEKYSKEKNMSFSFGINSNGIDISEEKCNYCVEKNISLNISCDGMEKTCSLSRHGASKYGDYKTFYKSMMSSLDRIMRMGVPHDVVMVVSPETLPDMKDNYLYLKSLGHDSIIVNYAVGLFWSESDQRLFMENLLELQKNIKTDSIINQLGKRNEPVSLNSRALYDYDGSVYGITAFFLNSDSQRVKNSFLIADKLTSDVFFNPEQSQADCLWSLLSAYGNDLKSLRLLVNNVEFGMKLKKMQVNFTNYRLNK